MNFPFFMGTWEYVDHGTPTWLIWLTIVGGGAILKAMFKGGTTTPARDTPGQKPPETPRASAPALTLLPPEKTICLVGRTSAGKSSLGNALTGTSPFAVGIEHGTTTGFQAVPYHGGYELQDTPGLLDGEQYSARVLDAAKQSELVIFMTTSQLFRQELDFLRDLCVTQNRWNRTRKPTEPGRCTLVFLNACDLKERMMPSTRRANELAALKAQVTPWLGPDAVLTGAAAPLDNSPPWIASLQGYLVHFCQQSAIRPAA